MTDRDIEGKIDDLARMVADGFTEVRGEMKEMREEMATKAESLASSGRPGTVGSRNRIGQHPQKHVWRARIVLLSRQDGDPAADRQRQADDLALV